MTQYNKQVATRGGAVFVALGIFLSRIAGLIREKLFAFYLGQSAEGDVFRAALRIPNFLQNLLGEGVLSGSLIPPYSKLLAEGKTKEARQLAAAVFGLLSLITLVLVALGVGLSHILVDIIAPGFEGYRRDLCIQLVRILFPGIGLLVFSAYCLGILNSHKKFFLSYVSPVIWNLAIIAALVWKGSGSELAPLVIWVTWGVVLGCALQFLVQVPSLVKLLGGFPFSFSFFKASRVSGMGQVFKNFFPILTSRGVLQLSAYLDTLIASFLPLGALSVISYAQTLYLLPVSLFGMSISAAELPEMSKLSASENLNVLLKKRVEGAVHKISIFIVPTIFAFIFLAPFILKILYRGGAFDAWTAWLVECTLWGSALGLLASTQSRVFSSAFYALTEAKIPLKFAIIRVFISAALGTALALYGPAYLGLGAIYGTCGLTLSFGISSWIEWYLLKKKLEAKIGTLESRKGFLLKLIFAAAVPGFLAFALQVWNPHLSSSYVYSSVMLGAFGLIYFFVAYVTGVSEVRTLIDTKILSRFKRKVL